MFYGVAAGTDNRPPDPIRHRRFIQDAVDLAPAAIDFSTADSVVVMIPSRATAVSAGPAFTENADRGYTADGKTFSNGVTSGADLLTWGSRWLNHESGHMMGLPELYAFRAANEDNRHRFVGGFSLMGLISGPAARPQSTSPSNAGKWVWLDDTQIVCLPSGGDTVTLTAIESPVGRKR
jgi:M6 family metalloprotease-like protein